MEGQGTNIRLILHDDTSGYEREDSLTVQMDGTDPIPVTSGTRVPQVRDALQDILGYLGHESIEVECRSRYVTGKDNDSK